MRKSIASSARARSSPVNFRNHVEKRALGVTSRLGFVNGREPLDAEPGAHHPRTASEWARRSPIRAEADIILVFESFHRAEIEDTCTDRGFRKS